MSIVLRATYPCPYSDFLIPPHVKLLTPDENDRITNNNVPGAWWIRWNVLHYYDADGQHQTIEPHHNSLIDDDDIKRPTETEFLTCEEAGCEDPAED
jgi:hypothetical protein